MSGIGMVLNTAKGAIAAQQIGLNVTGHNVANVNTSNYCRQVVSYSAEQPVKYGGVLLGTGVDVQEVQRICDQYLENRLESEKSDLSAFEEMAAYMNIMESLFNENSGSSLSTMMSEFWNSWQDLSNNPAGSSERIAVYEKGSRIAEQFDFLNAELMQLESELTQEMEAAVSEVNSLADQIAAINNEIVGLEATGTANDQRDKRNTLVTKLSELIDVKTFEQPNGSLTVMTANGYVLVNGTDTYSLEFQEGRVKWEASYGGKVDITDKIQGGKIGGWLEMRDEIIPKYIAELDGLARDFAWTVNLQHSQGVGLEYFSTEMTGTQATDSSGLLSTLTYGNRIDYSKDFKMWVKDASGVTASVVVDMDNSSLTVPPPSFTVTGQANSILDTYRFTVISGGSIDSGIEVRWSNSVTDGTFTLEAGGPYSVEIDGMTVDFTDPGDILSNGDVFTITTDENGSPSGNPADNLYWTLEEFRDRFNAAALTAGGGVTASITDNRIVFTPDAGYSFAFSDETNEDCGLAAALGINTFFQGEDAMTIEVNPLLAETKYIAAARLDATGDYGTGDNSNALTLADLQYAKQTMVQWDFERGSLSRSSALEATLEGFYHSMIGSMGIESVRISSARDFSEMMVNKISEQRDSLSGVSLDEEMVNMIKYQHAFSVASKLLTVADEMLKTLIEAR